MPYLRDFSLLFWYNESIKIKAVFPMMTQNADKKREQIQMFCMCHNTSMGQGCRPGRTRVLRTFFHTKIIFVLSLQLEFVL